jgi:hypothetical protein
MLFTIFFLMAVLNFLMLDFSLLTDQLNLDNLINSIYDQYNNIKTS